MAHNCKITEAVSSFGFDSKIYKQMEKRGWTTASMDKVISNPAHVSPAINKATGGAATAYFDANGAYIVIDNATGKVIQVSNRFDPNWVPDQTILNPPKK